jgi:hypothetical protein
MKLNQIRKDFISLRKPRRERLATQDQEGPKIRALSDLRLNLDHLLTQVLRIIQVESTRLNHPGAGREKLVHALLDSLISRGIPDLYSIPQTTRLLLRSLAPHAKILE